MTSTSPADPGRSLLFSPAPHSAATQAVSPASRPSKRSWCCFCPSEGPPPPAKSKAKPGKTLLHLKPPRPQPAPAVSSAEAGAAPHIAPIPSFGSVSEARALEKPKDALDFSRWR